NDTDSSAIDMHLTDPADICKWGKRLSKEISGTKDGGGVFEWPLEMAFEKGILDLGLFGKKMYAYLLSNEDGTVSYKKDKKKNIIKDKDGNPELDIMVKGLPPVRREHCPLVKKCFMACLICLFKGGNLRDCLEIVFKMAIDFTDGNVDPSDISSIRTVGDNYKSKTYFMKVFSDNLRERGKQVAAGDKLRFVIIRKDSEYPSNGTKGEKILFGN